MKVSKSTLWFILIILIFILINKQCEKPKEVVKTVTKVEIVKDTIHTVEVNEVVKTVFVDRIKTEKGKDSIIYLQSPNASTITANQYQTTLKSNDATADVQITTTGALLDVQGVITYPRIKETVTTIKNRNNSGLFIYGDLPITNNFNPEIGAIYQFKNTALIKAGAQYNSITNGVDVKIGIGIKIF